MKNHFFHFLEPKSQFYLKPEKFLSPSWAVGMSAPRRGSSNCLVFTCTHVLVVSFMCMLYVTHVPMQNFSRHVLSQH